MNPGFFSHAFQGLVAGDNRPGRNVFCIQGKSKFFILQVRTYPGPNSVNVPGRLQILWVCIFKASLINCQLIVDKIDKYELEDESLEFFDKVKELLDKYRFKEVLDLFDRESEKVFTDL